MSSLLELLKSGATPSRAFKLLIERGLANSNSELADLLYREVEGATPSVMIAVINWNRRENAAGASIGLSDERLDEVLMDLLGDRLRGGNAACGL